MIIMMCCAVMCCAALFCAVMPFAFVQLERDGIFPAQRRTLDNHSSHNTLLPETVTTTAPNTTTSVCAGQTAALLRIPLYCTSYSDSVAPLGMVH